MHLKQRRIQAAGDFRGAEPRQGNLPADSRHSSRGHFQFRRLPSDAREERERICLFDFKELVTAEVDRRTQRTWLDATSGMETLDLGAVKYDFQMKRQSEDLAASVCGLLLVDWLPSRLKGNVGVVMLLGPTR